MFRDLRPAAPEFASCRHDIARANTFLNSYIGAAKQQATTEAAALVCIELRARLCSHNGKWPRANRTWAIYIFNLQMAERVLLGALQLANPEPRKCLEPPRHFHLAQASFTANHAAGAVWQMHTKQFGHTPPTSHSQRYVLLTTFVSVKFSSVDFDVEHFTACVQHGWPNKRQTDAHNYAYVWSTLRLPIARMLRVLKKRAFPQWAHSASCGATQALEPARIRSGTQADSSPTCTTTAA